MLNHLRYGHHIGLQSTKKSVHGLHGDCTPVQQCECCILGGLAAKKSNRKVKAERAAANVVPGQVSMDTHGPYLIKSLGGDAYVQVFVDGKSRYMWRRLMQSKTETVAYLKEFCAEIGCPREILTDWGSEYAGAFRELCLKKGIQMRKSCPLYQLGEWLG